jgi:SAM-dependent methyltransferase
MTNAETNDAAAPPQASEKGNQDYLDVVYSTERRPVNQYPNKLARHILRRHLAPMELKKSARILDVGCGRGDMMRAFAAEGFHVEGVDLSPKAPELCKPYKVSLADFGDDSLPCPENSFDMIFCKSVIEHLRDPKKLLVGIHAALKPGGVAVIMTPSWMHLAWGPFYIDPTHVTPFTLPSLRDSLAMSGFDGVNVEHFRQLPFLWRYPFLTPLARLIAALPITYRPFFPDAPWPVGLNKLIWFSNEVMLMAVARKPIL